MASPVTTLHVGRGSPGVEEQQACSDEPTGPPSRPTSRGDASPWQKHGWNAEDLVEFLTSELDATRKLYEMPMTKETHIARSALAQAPCTLTFKDVAFEVQARNGSKTVILEPMSGTFEGGQLVALMGPSGSGKTTLMDILAAKKTGAYTGEILVNGHPRDRLFQRIAAYVGQEDVMPQYWTVREAVEFNFRLKSTGCRNVPPQFEERSVDILLASVGLSSVAKTYIGGPRVRGISGGQRRRVTLARGVAQRGRILFADEPTTGLSSTDAELVTRALRVVAKKYNVLVVVVIHQPRVEVTALFDHLMLLTAEPGRVVYNGPMDGAVAYWADCGFPVPEHANPSDFFLDLVTPRGPLDHADELVASFNKKLRAATDALVEQRRQEKGLTATQIIRASHRLQEEAHMKPFRLRLHPVAAPVHRQLKELLRRKLSLTKRNSAAIAVPIIIPCIAGVIMGAMFQGVANKAFVQQFGFVFILLTGICMSGIQQMPALLEERNIMKYDISENLYAVSCWIMVGITIDMTLSLAGVIGRCTIMYAFSGMPWAYYGLLLGWGILAFFVFDSFFGFVSSLASTLQVAQVSSLPFIMIFMMFSGFMITKTSAPYWLRWIFEISPIGYAVEAIFISMADDLGPTGQALVKQFGFEKNRTLQGVLVLLAMIVVFRVLQVIGLTHCNKIQK